ncbi:MAG: hypothetical protein M1840_002647 [Geoglossum simile]|nr:MAG: hypothetical protein M1840_002647 [Geoglossum simile]
MVLTELSPNHIARNGNFDVESGFPSRDLFAIRGGAPAVPLSHRNTLKKTIEAGDAGPLSLKQSRLPHPVARISPRKYRSTFDVAATADTTFVPPIPDLGPYAAAQGEAAASWGMNMSTASSIISMYGRDSPNNPRTAFRQTSDQDYRSFSMTQGPFTPASLSNHRSFSSLRDSRVLGTPARPRSPFTYPTRLKRPGFKPPSPTSSDVGAVDDRNAARLERGLSSRASSPSSPHLKGRLPGGRQDLNRSVPPLLVLPPLSAHLRRRSRGKPPASRVATQLLASISSPDHLGALPSGSNAQPLGQSTRHGTDKPPVPLYYDYTEAFEDDEFSLNRPTSSFPFLTIDRTIPENSPVSNSSSTGKDAQEVVEQRANMGDCGQQPGHSEPAGSPSANMDEPITSHPTMTESLNDIFHVKSFGSLDIGAPSSPRTTTNGAGYHLTQSRNAYPTRNPNRNYDDLDTPTASISQSQSAICHFQDAETQEGTEIYTRLSTRRRDRYLPTPRELHAEEAYKQEAYKQEAYKQEPADNGRRGKGATEPFRLEGDGAALERPTSSYSRRSSIRRFFSSDQGFEDMPEIVTTFEGIGRPYTPDRFLPGSTEAQCSHTTKESSDHIKRLDSASIDGFDLQHSRSASDGEDLRSNNKLTKRSSNEKEPKILTVVGDISAIHDVPRIHPVLRESSRRKRRFSLTAQADFQVAISGLTGANLMKQLPQLPVLQTREPISFPLPPSTTPVGVLFPSMLSTKNGIPAEGEGLVPAISGGVNVASTSDDQITPKMSLENTHSPLFPIPSSGGDLGLGEPQRANLAREMTVPQKLKVGARPPLTDYRVLESFDTPINFEAFSPSPSLTPKAPFVAGETMKKVSFQEARQIPITVNPPKFILRSSVTPPSRPYKPALGISRGEAQSKAFDRDVSDRLLSGGCAPGGRLYGPETRETAFSGRLSTGSDDNGRGRSSNIGLNPALRHANPSEPRSVFSDDSSQIATNRNAIKRLTNLRAKLPILSASRRSKDGPGLSDRAAANLTVAKPRKKVRIQSPRRAVGLCEARYKVKKLASRLGSWFHRRRERSRVVFRSFRNGGTASVGKAGVMYPGV